MENLRLAIKLIEQEIAVLVAASEKFYAAGDNFRGNIRHDSAHALRLELARLVLMVDGLEKALQK